MSNEQPYHSSSPEKPENQPQEKTPSFDWKVFGIEDENSIALGDIERIFEKRPELVEEMKKVFSMNLKLALQDDYDSRHGGRLQGIAGRYGPWYFENFFPIERWSRSSPTGKVKPERQQILGEDHERRCLAQANLPCFGKNKSQMLSFVFSVDSKIIAEGSLLNPFLAPQDLRFHTIFFSERSPMVIHAPVSEAAQNPSASAKADPKTLSEALSVLQKERADCHAAIEDVERLGKELGLNPLEIEKLQLAISDFATYVKPEPKTDHERFCEIGRCFTVPNMFQDYCKTMHGLNIGIDFWNRESRGHSQFYHEINILNEKLIVDWTARQYRMFDQESYPLVYALGDERVRGWGALAVSQKEEHDRLYQEQREADAKESY